MPSSGMYAPSERSSNVKESPVNELCVLVLLICGVSQEQAKWYKDLADFTKSPTEHIIVFLDEAFVVRSVEGVIRTERGPDDPLSDVLLELQGPGSDKRIRSTRTDRQGRFQMRRVPNGTYRFKATLDGFQSVVGTIVVSKKSKIKEIEIQMPFGV